MDHQRDRYEQLNPDESGIRKEGSHSPTAAKRIVLSPVQTNKTSSFASRPKPVLQVDVKAASNPTAKAPPSRKPPRKFDPRRESVELTKYFEQLASGPGFDDDDDLLPAVNHSGLSRPADRSAAGLQPLAEEEPEESSGNSARSGSPEEAAEAEHEHSEQPEQQQATAGMLVTEHINADSRSPPRVQFSHAAKTSSDLRDGQGCSSLRDSLDDQQGGAQEPPPTMSLVGPGAVSEPTAADSGDQPVVGAQTDDPVQPEHSSEPISVKSEDQLSAEAERAGFKPQVSAPRAAGCEDPAELEVPEGSSIEEPKHASEPTSVKSEDQLSVEAERAGLEPKSSAPKAAAGSEDPAELEVSEGSGIEEPEQADAEAQRAKGSALGADSTAQGQPGEQGESPEPASAVAACGAELSPSAAAEETGPGPHIEDCAAVEACSPDIDSTASPGQHSAQPLQAITPGTEQAERQPQPKPPPASRFPTRLLDDFAMIITPVRQLTEAAAKQNGPAGAQQAPDPADQHQRRLEDALSEPDDSPELASPVPADRQSTSDTEADQVLAYVHKLASVIRFASPVDSRAAVGAVTPVTDRPASASEHQRWEVYGEDSTLVPVSIAAEAAPVTATAQLFANSPGQGNLDDETAEAVDPADVPLPDQDIAKENALDAGPYNAAEAQGDAPDARQEALDAESDDGNEEEPIFAYLSASGIVTPAKAALTPATFPRPSAARLSRFQPSSVPKQPFIATLPAALEDSEEGSGLKDTGPPQPAATPDTANAPAVSPPPMNDTAGATATEPAVAAVLAAALDAVAAQPDHFVPQQPVSSPDGSAEQNAADEQASHERNGAADSDTTAQEQPAAAAEPAHAVQTAAPAGDEMDAAAVIAGPPSASAAVEPQPVMGPEATQLECFEQLPLDLLQDSGEASAPAVAGLLSTSPSCTRLGSGGSGLSRFASGQSLFSDSLAPTREQPSQLSALSCARSAAAETDSSAGMPLRSAAAVVTQADEAVSEELLSAAAAVSNTADSLEAAPKPPATPASEEPAGETEGGLPAAAAVASEAASAEGQWIAAKADGKDAEPERHVASAAAQQTFGDAQQQLAHPADAAAVVLGVAGSEQVDRKQQELAEQAGDGTPLEPPQPLIAASKSNSEAAQPTSALDICIAAERTTDATAASAEPPQLVSAVQDTESDAAETASQITKNAADEDRVLATAPSAEPSKPVPAAQGVEATAPADRLDICIAAAEAAGATGASAEPPQPFSAMPEPGSDATQEASEPEICAPAEETGPAAAKPAGSEPLPQPANEPANTPAALAKEKSVSPLGSAKPSGRAQKAAAPLAAKPARPPSVASKLRKPASSSTYGGGNGTEPAPSTAASPYVAATPGAASHIPKPSARARPPRASSVGVSSLPRLAKAGSSGAGKPAPAPAASRADGRPPAGSSAKPANVALKTEVRAAPSRVPSNSKLPASKPPQSRLRAPASRPPVPSKSSSSPPARLPGKALLTDARTPPPALDRRTPEYERLLNAALADEAKAFQGHSKKVANSPLEGGSKVAEQTSRLTAYDKHLREWDGEPLG